MSNLLAIQDKVLNEIIDKTGNEFQYFKIEFKHNFLKELCIADKDKYFTPTGLAFLALKVYFAGRYSFNGIKELDTFKDYVKEGKRQLKIKNND